MQEESHVIKMREAAICLQVIMSAATPATGFTDRLKGFFSSTKPNPAPVISLDTILASMINEILAKKPIVNMRAYIEGLDKNYISWLKQHSEVSQKMHPSLVKFKHIQDNAKRYEQLMREIKAELAP